MQGRRGRVPHGGGLRADADVRADGRPGRGRRRRAARARGREGALRPRHARHGAAPVRHADEPAGGQDRRGVAPPGGRAARASPSAPPRTRRRCSATKRAEGVLLGGGERLPADLVVFASGVKPRIDLAQDSDVPTNAGILVNDQLATHLPGLYAVGECAEHDGRVYGIVQPVCEQCAVLADVLTGANPEPRYRGSKVYTRLKVVGVEVASMGDIDAARGRRRGGAGDRGAAGRLPQAGRPRRPARRGGAGRRRVGRGRDWSGGSSAATRCPRTASTCSPRRTARPSRPAGSSATATR